MAKRKYSFTDLSDDIVVQKPVEKTIINNSTNTTNSINNMNEINDSNVLVNKEKNIQSNTLNSEVEEIKEEKYVSKYDIDINYDEDEPIEKNITNNNVNTSNNNELENNLSKNDNQYENQNSNITFQTNEESKLVFKEKPIEKRNNTKSTIMTFNESLHQQNNNEIKINEFPNNSKASELFTSKEKLDVKTNIYLKPKLVFKIKELVDKTGESRSSIINKLIEFALQEMEK